VIRGEVDSAVGIGSEVLERRHGFIGGDMMYGSLESIQLLACGHWNSKITSYSLEKGRRV
jgi:hypothetical protein